MDTSEERFQQLLRHSGWSPNYCVDTSRYQKYLEDAGFTISPPVLAFLRQFGGIKISGIHPFTKREYEWINIDPIRVWDRKELWFYSKIERAIGQPVCPVGTTEQDHQLLLVDSGGQFYTNYEDGIYYVSDNPMDTIRILCTSIENIKLIATI